MLRSSSVPCASRPATTCWATSTGLIRVPRAEAAEIAEAAVVAMQTENKVRTAILAGTDPQAAYLRYGKF